MEEEKNQLALEVACKNSQIEDFSQLLAAKNASETEANGKLSLAFENNLDNSIILIAAKSALQIALTAKEQKIEELNLALAAKDTEANGKQSSAWNNLYKWIIQIDAKSVSDKAIEKLSQALSDKNQKIEELNLTLAAKNASEIKANGKPAISMKPLIELSW